MHHLLPFLSLLTASVVAQNPATISVNFRGASGRAVTGPAGAAAAPSWNNFAGGNQATPQVLIDASGVDSGARLTFASDSGGFQFNPPGTSQDAALYDGQILMREDRSGRVTVDVTSIPYASYDVYVYFGHGSTHAGASASTSDGTTTIFFRNESLGSYVDPVTFREVASTALPGTVGNYARFGNRTSPTLTLTLDHEPTAVSSGRSGIAGLQIVAAGTTSLDTDNDGLLDVVETNTGVFVSANDTGTDPLDPDTDGDGWNDGVEVARGTDPNDPTSVPDHANVVLIMVDDLGIGDLGAYGQTRIQTPNLDRLAADGMRFTNFYAGSSVCLSTRSSLMTGQHTGHCFHRYNFGLGSYQLPMPAGTFTVGHMLHNAGYTTSCCGKWGMGGPGSTGEPGSQGFDHFFGYLGQVQAHWYYPAHLWRHDAQGLNQVFYPGNNGIQGGGNAGTHHSADEITAESLRFIDQHRDRPFFLYAAWSMPHWALQPPPHSDPALAALGQTAIDEFYSGVTWSEPNAGCRTNGVTISQPRRAWAAMITAIDRDVGLLLAKLDQHGLADDTLVLFTSDNGVQNGCGVPQFFNSAAGLRGTKTSLYEGGIRAPMIARWPGKIAPGTVSDHPSGLWDFMATAAEVAGTEPPAQTDGVSFLPTLLGQPQCQSEHEYLYWEDPNQRAVRLADERDASGNVTRSWKGIRNGSIASAPLELYDLASDPAESTNLANANPTIVAAIERTMASRHTISAQFFRGTDEFPIRSGITISNVAPGVQLAGNGHVMNPFPVDLDQPLEVDVAARVRATSGNQNAAVTFGGGTSIGLHVRFEVVADQSQFRIVHQTDTFTAPFAPGENPLRQFDLTCAFDPNTGSVEMREGNTSLVQGVLTNPPARVTHYGYRVAASTAAFGQLELRARGASSRGGFELRGVGCGGSAGVPLLQSLSTAPRLGSLFTSAVSAVPSGTMAFGLIGFGAYEPALDLGPIGMSGCELHVRQIAAVSLPVTGDRAEWKLPIPSEPSFLGIDLFEQAIVFDPPANALGLTISNAARLTVGVQ